MASPKSKLSLKKPNSEYPYMVLKHQTTTNTKTDAKDQETNDVPYIYHISDIHIRNHHRHQEYLDVFQKLYQSLKEEVSGLIVITGDIVHSKSHISPQLIIILRDFLQNLTQIMPTIMVAGNHDLTLTNKDVPDTLTSILHGNPIPNLYYLKQSGFYQWENIVFSVMSVLDYPLITSNDFPEHHLQKIKNPYKIGLLHATLNGSKISTSTQSLKSDIYNPTDFEGYDYLLLGDIHLHQYLNKNKTIAYAGSLIQQSFGETLTDHGYLIWEIETGESQLIPIHNTHGFVTLYMKNNELYPQHLLNQLPESINLRIQLLDPQSNLDTAEQFANQLGEQHELLQKIILPYTPEVQDGITDPDILELIHSAKSDDGDQDTTDPESSNPSFGAQILNLENPSFQKQLIEDYLSNRDELTISEMIRLHDHYQTQVAEATQNTNKDTDDPTTQTQQSFLWRLIDLEMENVLNFQGRSFLNFESLHGIVGIVGPNFSGKSNFLDAILFALFDKSSRGDRTDLLTYGEDQFNLKIRFQIGSYIYTIHRYGKANTTKTGPKVKIDVTFTRQRTQPNRQNDTSIETLTGENRLQTNKRIQEFIGSYDDFLLTSMKLQEGGLGNLIYLSNAQRKEKLVELLKLDILDQYYQRANTDLRDKKKELDLHSKELATFPKELNQDHEHVMDILTHTLKDHKITNLELENTQTQLQHLNKLLEPVDEELAAQPLEQVDEVNTDDIRKYESQLETMKIKLTELKDQLKPLFYEMTSKELKENIEIYQHTLDEEQENLTDLQADEKTLQEELNQLLLNRKEYLEELKDWDSVNEEFHHLQTIIQQTEANSDKLLNLQYDPNCNYCMNNVFVKDAKELQKQLKSNKNQLQNVEVYRNELLTLKEELEELEKDIDQTREKLQTTRDQIHKLEKEIDQWQQELKELKADQDNIDHNQALNKQIKTHQNQIQEMEATKKDLWEQLDKYQRSQKIKFEREKQAKNEIHLNKIQRLTSTKATLQARYLDLDSQKSDLLKEEQRLSDQVNRQFTLQEKTKNLREEIQNLTIYQSALGKDGIPKFLLERYLPEFERVVNLVMNDLVNFHIKMEVGEKKWNLFVVYPDKTTNNSTTTTTNSTITNSTTKQLNIDLCSGYEKFIVSIAIKCALHHLSQSSKSRCMIIDEGFGSLDQDHLGEIGKALNYLRSKFDYILLITHVEQIKEELDIQIPIHKTGSHSRINLT